MDKIKNKSKRADLKVMPFPVSINHATCDGDPPVRGRREPSGYRETTLGQQLPPSITTLYARTPSH